MPFTPYHFGPNAAAGMFFNRIINLPAFIFVNVAMDIEPGIVLLMKSSIYPEHGFFHSFGGAIIIGLLFSLFYISIKGPAHAFMAAIRLPQSRSIGPIIFGSLLGACLHTVFDSFLYRDITPFYPFDYNPFYGLISPPDLRMLCVISYGLAAVFYILKLALGKKIRRGYGPESDYSE